MVNFFQDHGIKCQNEDSFKTIHQKSGKSVLSRPSTKCAKNGPKSTPFKTITSQNVPKKGSFKTIEDGSKNDTSFKTIGEKTGKSDQKSTSFKTIANRVKNLNPCYMVPIDEVSHFRSSDQKEGTTSDKTAIQQSTTSRIKIQPHLCGARISVHQQYQGSSSVVPQQL